MARHRLLVLLPVAAGLVVTGSAVARILPGTTVRDSVYQTCAHNGVHFNKQGHPNCGLHKGWQSAPTSTTPDQPVTGTPAASSITPSARTPAAATSHPIKSDHAAGADHGAGTHGKSQHNKHG